MRGPEVDVLPSNIWTLIGQDIGLRQILDACLESINDSSAPVSSSASYLFLWKRMGIVGVVRERGTVIWVESEVGRDPGEVDEVIEGVAKSGVVQTEI